MVIIPDYSNYDLLEASSGSNNRKSRFDYLFHFLTSRFVLPAIDYSHISLPNSMLT